MKNPISPRCFEDDHEFFGKSFLLFDFSKIFATVTYDLLRLKRVHSNVVPSLLDVSYREANWKGLHHSLENSFLEVWYHIFPEEVLFEDRGRD